MCVPVWPSCSALQKRITMLTLHQLPVTTPTCTTSPNDSNNNTFLSPSAIKASVLRKPGLRRCLFGAPKPEENARIIEADNEANRTRMLTTWSWDVVKDVCDNSGNWAWERVKVPRTASTPVSRRNVTQVPEHRHHPYTGAVRSLVLDRASSGNSTSIEFHIPPIISPIPPTPVVRRVRTSSLSTTLSTSNSGEEDEVKSSDVSTLSPLSSSSLSSTESWTPPRYIPLSQLMTCSVKVQTRLTDFWRTRRSSCNEGRYVKSTPLAITKTGQGSEFAACSV